MDIKKSDERYYSVKVMSRLPLSEQLHEANAVLCKEAAEDESVFLERFRDKTQLEILAEVFCFSNRCGRLYL
jgi:hypothetical protein